MPALTYPVNSEIPNGLDRADGELDGSGVQVNMGTPAKPEQIIVKHANGTTIDTMAIEELPDSPEIERGEQCTVTHRFRMPWNEALNRLSYLGRGLIMEDSYGNVSRLLTAKANHEKLGTGILTTVGEMVSFDNPPDQFSCVPVELGINIIKHPRYFYALSGANQAEYEANQHVIRRLQDYFAIVNSESRRSILKSLNDSLGNLTNPSTSDFINGTDLAKRAAMEIVQKVWLGEETPYIAGYQITWSSYFWLPQLLSPGGYVEDPIQNANPGLPSYFWGTEEHGGTETIFDRMPKLNPQCYSSTGRQNGLPYISWLRKADDKQYERTWFKLIRNWIGSPIGYWDTQLYTSGPRPLVPTDYLTITPTEIPMTKTRRPH